MTITECLNALRSAATDKITFEAACEFAVTSGDRELKEAVAHSRRADPKWLGMLASQGNILYLASNPHTPPDALWTLYRNDTRGYSHASLAENPCTPQDLLLELVKTTHDWFVLRQCAINHNTPTEAISILIDSASLRNRKMKAVQEGYSPWHDIRSSICYRDLDPEIAWQLAEDPSTWRDLAENHSVPIEIIQKIAREDTFWATLEAADENLEARRRD